MKRSPAILLKPPDVERRVKTQRRRDVQRVGITNHLENLEWSYEAWREFARA